MQNIQKLVQVQLTTSHVIPAMQSLLILNNNSFHSLSNIRFFFFAFLFCLTECLDSQKIISFIFQRVGTWFSTFFFCTLTSQYLATHLYIKGINKWSQIDQYYSWLWIYNNAKTLISWWGIKPKELYFSHQLFKVAFTSSVYVHSLFLNRKLTCIVATQHTKANWPSQWWYPMV